MKKITIILSVVVLFASCTKLDETVYDQIPSGEYFKTEEQVRGTLTTIYDEIRGDWGGKGYMGADRGWYDLNEISSDECMIPIRDGGSAWQDGGIWVQTYRHEWTPSHPFVEQTWNWLYRAISQCNQAIELLEEKKANPQFIAEAKVLRAQFYYMLMDGWGDVPIVTSTKTTVSEVVQSTRAEVFAFVEKELKENVSNLSANKSLYGRFTKGAGFAVMAKVYLNAQIYIGTPKWAEAIAVCDSIIGLNYSLVSGSQYFDKGSNGLFGDVCNSNEVIYAISVDATKNPRNIVGIRSLRFEHGQALTFGKVSTWGGSTAHRDFIEKFQDEDIRKEQWVSNAKDRSGSTVQKAPAAGGGDLIYNLDIADIEDAGNFDGLRNIKFNIIAGYNGEGIGEINSGSANNDFPVYRFADILLVKAEAILRNGGSPADAVVYLNQVRNRAGLVNYPGVVTLEEIYDERGRELCWEGLRRQDMIRFGKYNTGHDFAPPSASKYNLFPKAPNTLANNPKLTQNPGY